MSPGTAAVSRRRHLGSTSTTSEPRAAKSEHAGYSHVTPTIDDEAAATMERVLVG
jgi:hypothetical protein